VLASRYSSLGVVCAFYDLFSTLPHAVATVWFERHSWNLALFKSPEARRLAWLASVPLEEKFAKETRLFGFGDFLVCRYKELSYAFQKTSNAQRSKHSLRILLLSSLTVIGHFSTLVWLLLYVKQGNLSGGACNSVC